MKKSIIWMTVSCLITIALSMVSCAQEPTEEVEVTPPEAVEEVTKEEEEEATSPEEELARTTEETTPELPESSAVTLVVEIIEDTDSSCVWEGAWDVQDNPGASGGTWTAAPPSGQVATYDGKATITFTGTKVALRCITAPHAGRVSVSIDGVEYPDIDMYSADVAFQVKDIATDLENTEHVLVLQQLHERNFLSAGYVVVIDAIQVTRPD